MVPLALGQFALWGLVNEMDAVPRLGVVEKKQPRAVVFLNSGGGWVTMCQLASRAYEHWIELLLSDRLIMLKTTRALLIPT